MTMSDLETKAAEIENWLNAHPDHPRFEEGFEKLRAVLNDMAKEHLNKKPEEIIQQRLF